MRTCPCSDRTQGSGWQRALRRQTADQGSPPSARRKSHRGGTRACSAWHYWSPAHRGGSRDRSSRRHARNLLTTCGHPSLGAKLATGLGTTLYAVDNGRWATIEQGIPSISNGTTTKSLASRGCFCVSRCGSAKIVG